MSRGKVLVLDDDVLTGKTIQKVVAFNDYESRLANEADEFFRIYREWKPDYIALDLIMPKMDGMQILAELAALKCNSAIIITSGVGKRVLDAAMRAAREQGLHVLGVLGKPFNAASLKALLDSYIPFNLGQEDETEKDNPADIAQGKVAEASSSQHWMLKSPLTADDLEQALERHELFNVYQPKVDSHSLVLTGFEALVRWQHPVRGLIPPDAFVPLAEENGLIDRLTIGVLNDALGWFAKQRLHGSAFHNFLQHADNLSVAVNISAKTLNNPAIFDKFFEMCSMWNVHPQQVIFELTESSAMQNPVTALSILTRLRMRGFRLSIDDFGTGFSSMLQLVRLPFSEIKVDKSFVMTALASSESRAVIKSIIDLAHSLGLQVTAEGIETAETLDYLKNQGCDLLQGYYIAAPMREADVGKWLERRYPQQEQQRVAALHATNLLDSAPEERFDSLIALARRLFDVPMAFFSLLDEERLWIKSRAGVGISQMSRIDSICTHTIKGSGLLVVEDALEDQRFAHLPLVNETPGVRFYAGCAIESNEGSRIGTVCLLDTKPRHFFELETRVLQQFARLIEQQLRPAAPELKDDVTRLLNREGFEVNAVVALGLCFQLKKVSAMVMYDLEGRDGEVIDAPVMSLFAGILRSCLRSSDVIARFAPEARFMIFLVGVDQEAAEKILGRIANEALRYQQQQGLLQKVVAHARIALSRPAQEENLQSFYSRVELSAERSLIPG
ncbi:MAG: EAL domain-containing protein [Pseudomonadota bacterium]